MRELERFNQFVHKTTTCWFWIGNKNPAGYGQMSWKKQDSNHKMHAHRAAWILFRGPIPKGKQVCHFCDIPACVNPEHLFIGSRKDNMRDAANKGTMNRFREGLEPCKTCKYGHSMHEGKTGRRWCLICTRQQAKESYRRTHKVPPSKFRTV